MRVCIYTIGDQVNGFGHVMRSLVLAEQLQQRGAEVVLATPTATPGLARLRRSSFDLAEILTTSDGWALPEADLLVIDVEHGPRREFLESVRQNFKTLVTVCGSGYKVDDPAAVDELSDLIVEQNPFDVTHVMATEMLTGPQYIMIDPRYAELTADPEGPIVVSLGGADPYGCTQPIANALGAAGYGGVRVVVGPAAGMPDIRNGAPEIIHAPESLLSVLDGASALIGALGMTAYEAAAAGVPSLLVSWTADHARTVSWPSLVAKECPIEDLEESYRLMFPGRSVKALVFSSVREHDDVDAMNAYIGEAGRSHGHPTLMYAFPAWSGKEVDRRIRAGRFLGVKVYLNLAPAYLPRQEIRIFDFLPPHQLEVMDRLGLVVMLHVPRDLRLRDPVNLAQILEIEGRYRGLQLVLAHVGRAYCNEDVGDAFRILEGTERLVFDFAANTNDWVFEQALRAVGPKRVLFGSDLPIVRMRLRRICENGVYVNLVPRGLYGEVSGDRNMREIDGPEAGRLTFFMYEELLAFRRAAERVGLSAADLQDVFYDNAARILARAGFRGS